MWARTLSGAVLALVATAVAGQGVPTAPEVTFDEIAEEVGGAIHQLTCAAFFQASALAVPVVDSDTLAAERGQAEVALTAAVQDLYLGAAALIADQNGTRVQEELDRTFYLIEQETIGHLQGLRESEEPIVYYWRFKLFCDRELATARRAIERGGMEPRGPLDPPEF